MEPLVDGNAAQTPEMKISPATQHVTEMKTAPPQTVTLLGSMAPAVRLIRRDELNKRMSDGEVIQIVNVLSPDKYTLGLIKGSIKIPLDALDARSGELDKSKLTITYCANIACNASRVAAEKLMAKGFNVRAYEGGIQEWKTANLPTEI